MASSGMLRRVVLVRTYLSEESSASIIRETRIGELGTTAVTSNRRTQQEKPYVPPKSRLKVVHTVATVILRFERIK
jgi:hypothetical protein